MNILFLCTANLNRSRTAEDFYRSTSAADQYRSAGLSQKYCQKYSYNSFFVIIELLKMQKCLLWDKHAYSAYC